MKFCSSTGCCVKGQLIFEHTLGHDIPERMFKLSKLIFSSAEWK